MKVIYVGPLNPGGTCLSRLKGLRALDLEITPFNTDVFFKRRSRLQWLVEHFCFIGPSYLKANQKLKDLCIRESPDVVWIDKGFWVWPSTLRELRNRNIYLAQHNTDCLWPKHTAYRWGYALMRRSLRCYDLYFTSNSLDWTRIRKSAIGHRCELTQLGYDPDRFNTGSPSLAPNRWTEKLLFVGHYEPRTEEYLTAVARSGLPLAIHGASWEKARREVALQQCLTPDLLSDQDYELSLRSAAIGLGFVSEWNGNQTAGRSFEIPACGTFLLAMRTPEHERLYREGTEAEFFSTPRELVEKRPALSRTRWSVKKWQRQVGCGAKVQVTHGNP